MSPELRIIIVDDEPHCREALRVFLQADCPEALIVGEAPSVAQALQMLPAAKPDLLLLDVQLEDGTGFDLLDRMPKPTFRVIFTTAHNEFALRAFRYSAVDYLLKPVDPADLIAAVRRVCRPGDPAIFQRQIDQLRHHNTTRLFDRITLNLGNGLLFTRPDEILRIESQGNYTYVFLENGEKHLVSQLLATFEEMLPGPPFFRAHQSHLVNTAFIRKLSRDEGDSLMMVDKSVVPLARRRKEAFVEMMAQSKRFG
ncbi:MAG: LytTR family DNA-binding domain-containing protein [Saprospiraceae bacterium]